jgi:hypothetical protein
MADTVRLPPTGTGTADIDVAVDTISGAQFQYVKLADGALDSGQPIEGGWQMGRFGMLVEDRKLRRVVEEFLVAATELKLLPAMLADDTSVGILTGHINVTNGPTVLSTNSARRRILITNNQTVTIYVGDRTVSTTSGYALGAGSSLTLETIADLWAITTSAYTAASEDTKVHYLELT